MPDPSQNITHGDRLHVQTLHLILNENRIFYQLIRRGAHRRRAECHLCGPESLSVGRSAGTAAPLCALLCLFKYSRQCCWSAWERRAHGAAALPLRRVKQPSSNRTGDRNDKSTHRMRSLFDPNR